MPERGELTKLVGVAKGRDFQRRRGVDTRPLQQRSEHVAHLLEMHRHRAPALLSGIGGHGEMRRMYLHPSRLIGEQMERRAEEQSWQQDRVQCFFKTSRAERGSPRTTIMVAVGVPRCARNL